MKTTKITLVFILTLAMVFTIAPSFKTIKADDAINIKSGPSIGNIYISKTIGKKNITIKTNGKGSYTKGDDPTVYYLDKTIVKLFKNGKLYATKSIPANSQAVFEDVQVSYGKKDSFKVTLYMNILGEEKMGPS